MDRDTGQGLGLLLIAAVAGFLIALLLTAAYRFPLAMQQCYFPSFAHSEECFIHTMWTGEDL